MCTGCISLLKQTKAEWTTFLSLSLSLRALKVCPKMRAIIISLKNWNSFEIYKKKRTTNWYSSLNLTGTAKNLFLKNFEALALGLALGLPPAVWTRTVALRQKSLCTISKLKSFQSLGSIELEQSHIVEIKNKDQRKKNGSHFSSFSFSFSFSFSSFSSSLFSRNFRRRDLTRTMRGWP